jgi:hypothetical protein
MRSRWLPCAALMLFLAAPPACLAAPKPEDNKPPKADGPGLVVRIRSIDGLLDDFYYVAKLVGKEEEAKQLQKMVEGRVGKEGLAGIDTKRPMGAYGTIGPAVHDSTAVALIPIADEKAVLGLLENLNLKAEKGDDDVYTVMPEKSPVPIYFRFANKYAYVTAQNKDTLDPKKLLAPTAVFPKGDQALLTITARIDKIPKGLKQAYLAQMEEALAKAKEEKVTGDTEAEKSLQRELIDGMGQLFTMLTNEGEAVELKLDLDRKTDEFIFELSLSGVEDSSLAASIKKIGQAKSVFGGLKAKDSAISGLIHMGLPEKIRKAMEPAIDEAIKKELEKETDKTKRDEEEKVVKALLPSLKAGELDAAFDFRGPSKDNLYTVVGGLKVKDGKELEKVVRKAAADAPEADKKKIKFDAAKAGDVAIHQADISGDLDADAKGILGDSPAYFAFRDDALLIAFGPDALAAIKEAATLKPQVGRPFYLEVSLARFAPIMEKETPGAAQAVEEAFGKNTDADKIRIAIEGGERFRLRLSGKAQLLKFFALMDEAKKK